MHFKQVQCIPMWNGARVIIAITQTKHACIFYDQGGWARFFLWHALMSSSSFMLLWCQFLNNTSSVALVTAVKTALPYQVHCMKANFSSVYRNCTSPNLLRKAFCQATKTLCHISIEVFCFLIKRIHAWRRQDDVTIYFVKGHLVAEVAVPSGVYS